MSNSPVEEKFDDFDWVFGVRDTVEMDRDNDFSFIRELHEEDKDSFIKCYVELLQRQGASVTEAIDKITSGTMSLNDWELVMSSCNLKRKYRIYRPAYWGETWGRKHYNSRASAYHALIRVYGNGKKITNLLIAKNHISYLPHVNASNWSNFDIGLDFVVK